MNMKSMIDKAVSTLAVIVLYTASATSTLANQNDEVILYLNDPLGSAVAAYDENGNVCWEEAHTPFGDKTVMEDSFNGKGCGVVAEERGFTGHSEDFETDLVYIQQRYYDPTVGRFLSTDPVGPKLGDPRTTNRYSYAANNPYKYVDPDGRIFVSGTIAAITLASVAYSAYTGYQDNGAAGAAAEVSGYTDAKEFIEAFSNGDYSGAALSAALIACKQCKAVDSVVPNSAVKLLGQPITFNKKDLDRVISKHGPSLSGKGGSLKSRFFEGEDIADLISQGTHMSRVKQASGKNYQRIYNVGREIGTDVTTGKPTSTITIITQPSGWLVTAHPGTP